MSRLGPVHCQPHIKQQQHRLKFTKFTRHHPHLPSIAATGAAVLLVLWILYSTASLQQQAHQLHSSGARQQLKKFSVEELYGPKAGRWPSTASAGPSQLLVLSYYSSRASLAARLLMLMGVYAGEVAQLRIGADRGHAAALLQHIESGVHPTASLHLTVRTQTQRTSFGGGSCTS